MKKRVDEIELEASEGGDAEERELQWVGSLRDRVREIEQEAKYVRGEPTERTKSLSRINVLNAPVGEGGQPKRTQFEEDRRRRSSSKISITMPSWAIRFLRTKSLVVTSLVLQISTAPFWTRMGSNFPCGPPR